MCNIGEPLEILNVEPLSLPVPPRRETERPEEQPVTVEAPVEVAEKVLVEVEGA